MKLSNLETRKYEHQNRKFLSLFHQASVRIASGLILLKHPIQVVTAIVIDGPILRLEYIRKVGLAKEIRDQNKLPSTGRENRIIPLLQAYW